MRIHDQPQEITVAEEIRIRWLSMPRTKRGKMRRTLQMVLVDEDQEALRRWLIKIVIG